MALIRLHLPVRRVHVLLAVAALTAAACGSGGEASADGADAAGSVTGDGVQVVATTSILGDIASELVGDDGEVTVLMGPGVDPHAYSPSARDAAIMREADLVVAVGLQLEESLVSTLEATADAGVPVFELATQVDPMEYLAAGAHEDDHADDEHADDEHADDEHADDEHADDEHAEDDHDHGPEDPHVWFDPERVATGVELLADELAEVAPEVDAAEWSARGEDYAARIREVDAELSEAFAAVPEERRVLVTNHDALGYLAARYDLEVVGTVIPGASTQAETDARSFSELIAAVEAEGVDVVFADNTDSTRLAEQLASEVLGREDVELEVVQVATDALGEPGSDTATYLELVRETGTTIAEHLADAG